MTKPLPRSAAALALVLVLAGCNAPPASNPAQPAATQATSVPAPAAAIETPPPDPAQVPATEPAAKAVASAPVATPPKPAATTLPAKDLILAEWRKADNRKACAPMTLARDDAGGTPRRAQFAGGWAVAFDRPGLRSAYGIAGPGMLPQDENATEWQRQRLHRQWPHFRDLNGAVTGFAGYGIEGAKAYPASNPDGNGVKSLAYIRINGQSCTYNVWSHLGRAHLETMLDALTPLPH